MAEELGTKVEERPRDVLSRPSCGYDFPVTSSRTAGSVHNQRRENRPIGDERRRKKRETNF